jgi:predicted ATPase
MRAQRPRMPPGDGARLLERSGQLSALGGAPAAVVSSGRGRTVLVPGEAGMGKTALLLAADDPGRQFRSTAASRNAMPTSGRVQATRSIRP